MRLVLSALLLGLTLGACESPSQTAPALGCALDAQGCRPSAGYRWSALRGECIRLFELGLRLLPLSQDGSQQAAFVVFNADQSQAELYLPEAKVPLRLRREGEEGAHSWSGGAYKLLPWKGYVLQHNGQAAYAGDSAPAG